MSWWPPSLRCEHPSQRSPLLSAQGNRCQQDWGESQVSFKYSNNQTPLRFKSDRPSFSITLTQQLNLLRRDIHQHPFQGPRNIIQLGKYQYTGKWLGAIDKPTLPYTVSYTMGNSSQNHFTSSQSSGAKSLPWSWLLVSQ